LSCVNSSGLRRLDTMMLDRQRIIANITRACIARGDMHALATVGSNKSLMPMAQVLKIRA